MRDAQDVLRHALRTATSASGLWELLSDEIGCREAYLGERLDRTLQEIFDGVRQPDPAVGSGVQITTAMQEADRQMALWAEFVQQGATKERRENWPEPAP